MEFQLNYQSLDVSILLQFEAYFVIYMYLTNYHIICATVVVQLLVPLFHHAGFAVVVSLTKDNKEARLNYSNKTWKSFSCRDIC